VITGPL